MIEGEIILTAIIKYGVYLSSLIILLISELHN